MIGLFFLSSAFANGQTTHMWISLEALDYLPEGELRSLLEEPVNLDAMKNGTMFPDGGYAVAHPYGETAHWEPFQGLYRDWILSEFDSPMDPEAALHVSFYMGLASHGMADQVFDALYMERSKQHDAAEGWAKGEAFDTSSDIVWAWETGAQTPPAVWFPPIMADLFSEVGVDVDPDTLELGQERLGLAIDLVGAMGQLESGVQEHIDHFPWGCTHLGDRTIPGGPYSEAEIVAAYWEDLWAELNGEELPLEVLASFPKEGGRSHHLIAEEVESRLTVIFNRGLYQDELSSMEVHLTGEPDPPELFPWLFYRDNSHVLHFEPGSDFAQDVDYQLGIRRPVAATDGRELESDWLLRFSTKAFKEVETTGCQCASGRFHEGGRAFFLMGFLALFRRRES